VTTSALDRPTAPPPRASRPPAEDEPAALPHWACQAADGIDLESLRDRVIEADLAAAFDELRDHEAFIPALRASVEENLWHLRDVLSGRTRATSVLLGEPVALAELQARLRLPQTAVQRSYRVGFATMWEAWSERLVAQAEAHDVPRGESLAALRTMTALLLRYQDHVASRVADTFARADGALSRSREQVRAGLVRHLLRSDAPPLSPADLALLDYPVDAQHLAVLLPGVPEGAVRPHLAALRDATHTRDALVHPVDLSSTVVWLAQPGCPGWRARAADQVVDCLRVQEVEACVSQAAGGLDGLRRTWAQVHDVQRIRTAWAPLPPDRLAYDDVSLEVMLMADPVRARAFVAAELGELGAADALAERLRETVEASHRFGSHIVTAEHLHLHEHTVRNRLQRAAELLGRPLTERRTELQVALRLSRVLAQGGV